MSTGSTEREVDNLTQSLQEAGLVVMDYPVTWGPVERGGYNYIPQPGGFSRDPDDPEPGIVGDRTTVWSDDNDQTFTSFEMHYNSNYVRHLRAFIDRFGDEDDDDLREELGATIYGMRINARVSRWAQFETAPGTSRHYLYVVVTDETKPKSWTLWATTEYQDPDSTLFKRTESSDMLTGMLSEIDGNPVPWDNDIHDLQFSIGSYPEVFDNFAFANDADRLDFVDSVLSGNAYVMPTSINHGYGEDLRMRVHQLELTLIAAAPPISGEYLGDQQRYLGF